MAPQVDLLERLCNKPETLTAAKALLHIAKVKTAAGSGHDLGNGASGLPAICALIASLRLRNDDVSENVAQKSSCLAPKLFKTTLATVKLVLHEADTRKHALGHSELSYETLLSRHSIGGAPEIRQKLLRWMHEAEAGVMQSDRVQRRYEHQASLVKCAVFSWTCTRIKIERDSLESLPEQNNLSPKTFNALLKTLDKTCDALGLRMTTEVEAHRRTHLAGAAASNSSRRKSPSKGGAAHPARPNTKRRASTSTARQEDAAEPPDRSTAVVTLTRKRQKLEPSASIDKRVPPFLSDISAASNSRALRVTSNGGLTLRRSTRLAEDEKLHEQHTMDVDDEHVHDDWAASLRPNRRFRPVFLDYQQWFSRDSQLEREWNAAEAHKRKMIALYGHPFGPYQQVESCGLEVLL